MHIQAAKTPKSVKYVVNLLQFCIKQNSQQDARDIPARQVQLLAGQTYVYISFSMVLVRTEFHTIGPAKATKLSGRW